MIPSGSLASVAVPGWCFEGVRVPPVMTDVLGHCWPRRPLQRPKVPAAPAKVLTAEEQEAVRLKRKAAKVRTPRRTGT